MNLVFLDVDGVLNSKSWWDRRPPLPEGLSDDPQYHRERHAQRNLDPDAIRLLSRIVDAAHAHVVLSSSWRAMVPLPVFAGYLRKYGGFDGHLFGATPVIDGLEGARLPGDDWGRGTEIAMWLGMLPRGVVKSYVVLDDDRVRGHDGHFVQTDFEVGLTEERAELAIVMLQRPDARHLFNNAILTKDDAP